MEKVTANLIKLLLFCRINVHQYATSDSQENNKTAVAGANKAKVSSVWSSWHPASSTHTLYLSVIWRKVPQLDADWGHFGSWSATRRFHLPSSNGSRSLPGKIQLTGNIQCSMFCGDFLWWTELLTRSHRIRGAHGEASNCEICHPFPTKAWIFLGAAKFTKIQTTAFTPPTAFMQSCFRKTWEWWWCGCCGWL